MRLTLSGAAEENVLAIVRYIMTKLQSLIVFGCSVAALIASCIWYYVVRDFEPAIGIIMGIGGIAASYWPSPRLTPGQKIAARDKGRQIFEKFFWENAQTGFKTDAIVHDVSRLDYYPDNYGGKGISAWFRIGLMGTYHRGVLLGLRWVHIVQQPSGKWKENTQGTEGTKVILLGEVPYETIESVNWDGDAYYNKPHLFCHFEHRGEPYERLFYATESRLEHPTIKQPPFYTEVAQYELRKPWWKLF